ncbi:MAG: DNA-3-methyladenine glycosylase family protein, partial [Bryobacteraceae bacterium]
IPGCWEPLELCVRVILGQQVTVAAASTLMGRLGAISPGYRAPEIAKTNLSKLGVPARRARTIQLLAQASAAGELLFETQAWDDIAYVLRHIPGIGPWTISYLAIRLGRDPDAFPESDLGLLRAAGTGSPKELLRIAERWRPHRSYAAMHLWMQPQLPDSSTLRSGVA